MEDRGSASWGWVSYDAELTLIYFGTSNPGVWNPDMRPGNLCPPPSGRATWTRARPDGTLDGDFKAVNAMTGNELWKTHFASGVVRHWVP